MPEHIADLDKLKRVHLHGGDIINFQNESDANNSLLHYAVKQQVSIEVIDYLVMQGMNLDVQNKFGETPLHLCSGQ